MIYLQPMPPQQDTTPQGEEMGKIGYFIHGGVLCFVCAERGNVSGYTIMYRVNIWPYQQHCMCCKRELVKGQKGWPELFVYGDWG